MKTQCPNCTTPMSYATGEPLDHPENGCVLAVLIQALAEREEHTPARLRELHMNCDVDALWSDVGAIVDQLGDGDYEG